MFEKLIQSLSIILFSLTPVPSVELGKDIEPIDIETKILSEKPYSEFKLKQVRNIKSEPESQPASNSDGNAVKSGSKCSGGSLKDRIICCESGGSYVAQNPVSTASGRYQFLDTTWNNYKGYSKARLAPPAIQDEYFELHFSQNGVTPWEASRHCWG